MVTQITSDKRTLVKAIDEFNYVKLLNNFKKLKKKISNIRIVLLLVQFTKTFGIVFLIGIVVMGGGLVATLGIQSNKNNYEYNF